MSERGSSLISINDLSSEEIQSLFDLADKLEESDGHFLKYVKAPERPRVMAELFFEPSTRTRLGFQMAALRLGLKTAIIEVRSSSSIIKGESVVDTIETVAAMNPDVLVIRTSSTDDLMECMKSLKIPVVNGGTATWSHPTQALGDAFTVKKRLGSCKGKKVLYVGDVKHSRVANSGQALYTKLGAKVATCGPEAFKPSHSDWSDHQHFTNLSEAVSWADVVCGLRLQSERHEKSLVGFRREDYIRDYRLDEKNLRSLKPGGLIMHPGPFVPYVDFHPELIRHSSCVVRDQVTLGLPMKAAILSQALKLGVQ